MSRNRLRMTPSRTAPASHSDPIESAGPQKTMRGRYPMFVNWLLLAASFAFSCLLFEVALRYILDPLDFLMPVLVEDAKLGHRIAPNSGGHDAWGFRNRTVPTHADIVAIGDSTTYGLSAQFEQSWPALLASMSGHSVYNLGLGGYGPMEYATLLVARGASLTPDVVVIGLYLGNDIYDAYVSSAGQHDPEIEKLFQTKSAIQRVRQWLSMHSMLYGAAKAALPELVTLVRTRRYAETLGEGAVVVSLWGKEVVLTPRLIQRALDTEDERTTLGLERTKAEIRSMGHTCKANAIKCYFLLIPTKEYVLEPLVRGSLPEPQRHELQEMARLEEKVSQSLRDVITASNLKTIETLSALRAAARRTAIYPAADGHPNGAGYRVIAESVWNEIGPDLAADGMEPQR